MVTGLSGPQAILVTAGMSSRGSGGLGQPPPRCWLAGALIRYRKMGKDLRWGG